MDTFAYARARDSADALDLWAAAPEGARFLAGGTTLVDLLKLGVDHAPAVIDVRGMDGFAGIDSDGPEVVIGAGATMSAVAADPVVRDHYPALSQSLWRAASPQIRNMATVAGNLLQRTRCGYFRGGQPFACNKREPGSGCAAANGSDRDLAVLGTSETCRANYPGDWAVALVAFDALVDVVGAAGERTVRVEDLLVEPGTTPEREHTLEAGELIVRIRVPATPLGRRSTYLKIRDRESYAFALTSAATAVDLDGDVVRDVRIAIGGLAARPWRCRPAEALVRGQVLTEELALAAGRRALEGAVAGNENAFKIPLGERTVAWALMQVADRSQA